MNAREIAIVRGWLEANRGDQTQEGLAAAITAATGWRITRDRYSKYERGPLSIGPQVLAHFVDYWRTQGKPGPDFNPPMAVAPVDPMIAAMEAQTKAITALVGELREWRTADRDRLGAVERTAELLAARLLPEPEAEGSPARRVLRETAG